LGDFNDGKFHGEQIVRKKGKPQKVVYSLDGSCYYLEDNAIVGERIKEFSSLGEINTIIGKAVLEDASVLIGKRIYCKKQWSKEDGILIYPDGTIFIGSISKEYNSGKQEVKSSEAKGFRE